MLEELIKKIDKPARDRVKGCVEQYWRAIRAVRAGRPLTAELSRVRAAGRARLPCRFAMVAAMNPCPCGWHAARVRSCACTPFQVHRYRQRVSGPLLDRLDLQVGLRALSYAEIERRIREQMTAMFGDYGFDADRDIAGIITNRWGHAYVTPQPGFFFGSNGNPAPRDVVREGYGRVRFGHSELSGFQLWTTGVEEGERAAKQAMDLI